MRSRLLSNTSDLHPTFKNSALPYKLFHPSERCGKIFGKSPGVSSSWPYHWHSLTQQLAVRFLSLPLSPWFPPAVPFATSTPLTPAFILCHSPTSFTTLIRLARGTGLRCPPGRFFETVASLSSFSKSTESHTAMLCVVVQATWDCGSNVSVGSCDGCGVFRSNEPTVGGG